MRQALLIMGLVLLAVANVLALPPWDPPQIVAQVTRVIDGDTIDVRLVSVPEALLDELRAGTTVRVRYIGVDAPELEEPGGNEATRLNTLLVEDRTVYLEVENQLWDKYGRLLAYVYLDPTGCLMVNLTLIATPIIATKTYSDTQRYARIFECVDQCGGGPWGIIIFAVLPNPSGPEPYEEWIELKNVGTQKIDISGWVLSDGEGSYTIPSGTVLQPGEIWRVWGSQYNPTGNRRGLYLSNKGDCVTLLNPNGEEVDRCCWTDVQEDVIIRCH